MPIRSSDYPRPEHIEQATAAPGEKRRVGSDLRSEALQSLRQMSGFAAAAVLALELESAHELIAAIDKVIAELDGE